MNLKEIRKLTPDKVSKLSEKELESAVNQLINANRRKLKRLESTRLGKSSPAYKSAKELYRFDKAKINKSIAKFKNNPKISKATLKKKLERTLIDLKEWNNLKTSTPRGWSSVRKNVIKRLGIKKLSLKTEKEFWDLYQEYTKMYPEDESRLGSDIVQKICVDVQLNNKDMSLADQLKLARNEINTTYEQREKVRNKRRFTSNYFD
jgi:hypothetical protein